MQTVKRLEGERGWEVGEKGVGVGEEEECERGFAGLYAANVRVRVCMCMCMLVLFVFVFEHLCLFICDHAG